MASSPILIQRERKQYMKRTAFSPHNDLYINHVKTEQKHDMPVQHYHDLYEIYFQVSGTRYLFYDDICYTLKEGDIALFKPFELHYAESRDSDMYERYVINFSASLLSPLLTPSEILLLFEKLGSGVIHLSEENSKRTFEYFEAIEKYLSQKGFLSERSAVCELLQFLVFISNNSVESTHGRSEASPQIVSAIRFIGKHYKESLMLDDICAAAKMSKYHFSRVFKEATGATVMEYLNNIRLIKAHSLLTKTCYSFEEIAEETGFSSAVNLNRAFKKAYGMPPREFRKQHRAKD